MDTASTAGTMLLTQGQTGLGFESPEWPGVEINWKDCQSSG